MVHVTTVGDGAQLLSEFALVSALAALLTLILLHFRPTGVNPVSEAVSDYGVGPYKHLYRALVLWLGVSALLLAIALGNAIYPKPSLTILSLLVFTAVRWAITIFPTDLEDEETTPVGRSHTALAAIAFAAIAAAAVSFPFAVNDDRYWQQHDGVLAVLAAVVAVTSALTAVTRFVVAKRWFGLVERSLYGAMFAWLIVVSVLLATAG